MIGGINDEEAQENESLKGSFEAEKCEALLEKIEGRKKVSHLSERRYAHGANGIGYYS